MDRYEKLWTVVVAVREASAKLRASQPITLEKREEWSSTHGRAFFTALMEFFGDQDVFTPNVPYFDEGGKIDTRNLDSLRGAPDQQVVIRLAADMISVDLAPINSSLIPEVDQFSTKLRSIIIQRRID